MTVDELRQIYLRGMSQRKLAEYTGISRSSIQRILKGQAGRRVLERLEAIPTREFFQNWAESLGFSAIDDLGAAFEWAYSIDPIQGIAQFCDLLMPKPSEKDFWADFREWYDLVVA